MCVRARVVLSNNFRDARTQPVFWWIAMGSTGTSVCKLLRGLPWTVPKLPAEGSAVEDQNSCPFLDTVAPR